MHWRDSGDDEYAQQRAERPKKPRPDNIFIRIARSDNNNLNKAQQFLTTNGLPKAKDRMDLALTLAKMYKKHGDDIIPSLVELHPDKKIFEAHYEPMLVSKEQQVKGLTEKVDSLTTEVRKLRDENALLNTKQKFMSADGSGQSTQTTSNQQENSKGSSDNYLPLLATMGLIGMLSLSMIVISHNKS